MLSQEDNEKLEIINDILAVLDKAVLSFCSSIGKPEWIQD
jgi:hypothetical protein